MWANKTTFGPTTTMNPTTTEELKKLSFFLDRFSLTEKFVFDL